MTQHSDRLRKCPATAQSVLELEETGEVGCPLCGEWAELHRNEDDEPEMSLTEEWARDEAAHDWGSS